MQSVDSYEEIARRLLKTSKAAIEGAYMNVRACQNREFEPAKTGFKYLDDALLGGLRPQKVISIGARSVKSFQASISLILSKISST